MTRATGTFSTQTTAHPPYDTAAGATLGRMTIAKVFTGDLEGTSVVEMTSAMSEVKGSAGYVAIERIVGSLAGKRGSFVVQHTGVMNRGAASLVISIVPDCGSGELKTISGTMSIDIVEKVHHYTLDYSL